MRCVRLVRFSLAIVLLAICSAMVATAQQYNITRAEYGYGRQRVDVTQRLQDLARQNARFRMGNSTFGIDPSPGNVKTLWIYSRNNRGNRTFTYREGSWVDGSQFAGWGSGNWGGGGSGPGYPGGGNGGGNNDAWQIQHARYGSPRNNVDVTQRLRELAARDARFRMGNSTFGIDPDKGVVKYLRIYARGRNGRNRIFEYREGSWVDGSIFSAWGGGGWGGGNWNGGWNGNGNGRSGAWEVERR